MIAQHVHKVHIAAAAAFCLQNLMWLKLCREFTSHSPARNINVSLDKDSLALNEGILATIKDGRELELQRSHENIQSNRNPSTALGPQSGI